MRPIKTSKTNFTFKLPGGTDENDLPVERTVEDDRPIVNSTWELTYEERRLLAAGAQLELSIWSSPSIPPVALRITAPTCPACEVPMEEESIIRPSTGERQPAYRCPSCKSVRR